MFLQNPWFFFFWHEVLELCWILKIHRRFLKIFFIKIHNNLILGKPLWYIPQKFIAFFGKKSWKKVLKISSQSLILLYIFFLCSENNVYYQELNAIRPRSFLNRRKIYLGCVFANELLTSLYMRDVHIFGPKYSTEYFLMDPIISHSMRVLVIQNIDPSVGNCIKRSRQIYSTFYTRSCHFHVRKCLTPVHLRSAHYFFILSTFASIIPFAEPV